MKEPKLEWRANSAHEVLLRHPWATMPIVSRINVGPAMLRYIDATLGCLCEAGFSFVSLKEAERDPVYRDDIDPRLPPRESTLDGRASERGLAHPQTIDFAAKLAAICPSPNP